MTATKLMWKGILGATSTFGGSLDLSRPVLITIGFSHFSERARWLLDLTPLKYAEDRHLPAFHLARTLALDNLKRVRMPGCNADDTDKMVRRKEKTAVPKLIIPVDILKEDLRSQAPPGEKVVIVKDGSRGISRFVVANYPHEVGYLVPPQLCSQINELDDNLETVLAPAVTSFAFGSFLLCDRNAFVEDNRASRDFFINSCANTEAVPFIQRFLFNALGSKVIVPTMVKGNSLSAEATARARKDILSSFDQIERIRKAHGCTDESPHIFNTKEPTLADYSFAALAAPLLMPPQLNKLFFDKTEVQRLSSTAPGCAQYLQLHSILLEKYPSARAALRLYEKRPKTTGR